MVHSSQFFTGATMITALLGQGGRAQDTVPAQPIASRAYQTLHVRGYADFLVLHDGYAWVTNESRVERLAPDDSVPVAVVPINDPCGAMTIDFGALWVANCRTRSLVRVDLSSAAMVAEIPTGLADPTGELSVASGAGSVWVLSDSNGLLSRIDPLNNSVQAQIRVQPYSYAAAFGFGSVWVSTTGSPGAVNSGSVQRIDPSTNRVVATIPVGPAPRFLAVGEDGVWTLNQGDGTVTRINPNSNKRVATIETAVPGPGGDIAVGAGRVWVRASKILLQAIDPSTNTIVERYGPPAGSGAVRADDRRIWVTAHDVHTVWVLTAGDGPGN
jgi:virginiamycin B lyase